MICPEWNEGWGDENLKVIGWSVYIVECRTKDLYVGVAQDVNKRVALHNQGRACRYTKFRKPVQLIYVESCADYAEARKRERQIKKYSRVKKLALMKQVSDLSPQAQ